MGLFLKINHKNKFFINLDQLLITLTGHTEPVSCLAVLANGNLASGSYDQTIKIWNATDYSLIRTLTGHSDIVRSLALLRNGNLASCSSDNTIKIWNTNEGSQIKTIQTEFISGIYSLAVLQDDALAIGGGLFDSTIKILNASSGSLIRTLGGHTLIVESLAVLKNGYLVSASSSSDGIKVWNAIEGSLIKTFNSGARPLLALDNGYLASGSSDNTIKIWNTDDGSLIKSINAAGSVLALAVLKDGNLVGSVSAGLMYSFIKIWNINNGELIKMLIEHNSAVNALVVLKNGNLASACGDNTIKIFL